MRKLFIILATIPLGLLVVSYGASIILEKKGVDIQWLENLFMAVYWICIILLGLVSLYVLYIHD